MTAPADPPRRRDPKRSRIVVFVGVALALWAVVLSVGGTIWFLRLLSTLGTVHVVTWWGADIDSGVDLDGDGIDDYALAYSYAGNYTSESSRSGLVVFSGATGRRLMQAEPRRPREELAAGGVSFVDDVDGDGTPDLAAVGFEVDGEYSLDFRAVTRLFSGRNGSVIAERGDDVHGTPQLRVHPVLGRRGDELVLAPLASPEGGGAIGVLSASTLAPRRWIATGEDWLLGLAVTGDRLLVHARERPLLVRGDVIEPLPEVPGAPYEAGLWFPLGDRDGDGVLDFAVARFTLGPQGGQEAWKHGTGTLQVWSETADGWREGTVLLRWTGHDEGPFDVVAVDDVDEDGVADVAVGYRSRVELRSGATGELRGDLGSGGRHVELVDDRDGDGHRDLAIAGRREGRHYLRLVSPASGDELAFWWAEDE